MDSSTGYELTNSNTQMEEGISFIFSNFISIFPGTSMLEDSVRVLSDTEEITAGTAQELRRQREVLHHSQTIV